MTEITETPASTAAYAALGRELATRYEWLEVTSASARGGHDVVLRLDGAYSSPEAGEEMAAWFAERLDPLLRAAGAACRTEMAREWSALPTSPR